MKESTWTTDFKRERDFITAQFGDEPTLPQGLFDWIFGIILPIVCFYFDPIFFKSDDAIFGDNSGIFSNSAMFIYSLATTAITFLVLWKLIKKQLKPISAFIGILFYFSASASFILGLVLLPFSIWAFFAALIGALGFIPFISAFVYFRNGVRALRFAGQI